MQQHNAYSEWSVGQVREHAALNNAGRHQLQLYRVGGEGGVEWQPGGLLLQIARLARNQQKAFPGAEGT